MDHADIYLQQSYTVVLTKQPRKCIPLFWKFKGQNDLVVLLFLHQDHEKYCFVYSIDITKNMD